MARPEDTSAERVEQLSAEAEAREEGRKHRLLVLHRHEDGSPHIGITSDGGVAHICRTNHPGSKRIASMRSQGPLSEVTEAADDSAPTVTSTPPGHGCVVSDAYREGWERVFGKGKRGSA